MHTLTIVSVINNYFQWMCEADITSTVAAVCYKEKELLRTFELLILTEFKGYSLATFTGLKREFKRFDADICRPLDTAVGAQCSIRMWRES